MDSNVLDRPESLIQKRQLTMLRKRAGALVRNELREKNLSMSESLFLNEFIQRFSNNMPWAWVQRGTQEEWAYDWGMSTSTFKSVLRKLREKDILLGGMSEIPYKPKWAEGTEYPVWVINPVLIEKLATEKDMRYWILASDELTRFATTLGQPEADFWLTVKSNCRTYTMVTSPIPTPGQQKEIVEIEPVSEDSHFALDNPPISSNTSSSKQPRSTVSRRLRRRMLDKRGRITPMPVLGEDPEPDDPEPSPVSGNPVTVVEDYWERKWKAVVFKKPSLPPVPWAGNRMAFRGWVKKSLLPDQDHDVDLIKEMIDKFCEDVPLGTESTDPWRVFAGRQNRYRQQVLDARQRVVDMADLKERKAVVREERKVARKKREQAQAVEDQKPKPKFESVSEEDLLSMEDLYD